MKSGLLAFLLLTGSRFLAAQTTVTPDSTLYPEIFRMYALQNQEFYGVFDSTDSYFSCHFDSFTVSPFDHTAIIAGGKIWHRGQLTHFKAYFSVDDITRLIDYTASTDSSTEDIPESHWAFAHEMMKVPGTTLWQCAGEVLMVEDTTEKYAGIFSGVYELVFAYRSKTKYIKPLPLAPDLASTPGFYTGGFWRSADENPVGTISFCFSSSRPNCDDDGNCELPDLRMDIGPSGFSNIATFGSTSLKPQALWYQ